MGGLKLTRESILDGTLHASVRALLGPGARFATDAQRSAQVQAILERAPRPGRIWVFAFGSLIWNPAFHFVERRQAATELDVVWRREMFTMSYRPVWTMARTSKGPEPVIAFSANREHERYVPGLEDEVIARYLATGAGPMGRCCDYLFDTVAHLRQLGIRDRRLEALEARVRAHGAAG